VAESVLQEILLRLIFTFVLAFLGSDEFDFYLKLQHSTADWN